MNSLTVWKFQHIPSRPNSLNYCVFSSRGTLWFNDVRVAKSVHELLNKYERLMSDTNQEREEVYLQPIKDLLKVGEI